MEKLPQKDNDNLTWQEHHFKHSTQEVQTEGDTKTSTFRAELCWLDKYSLYAIYCMCSTLSVDRHKYVLCYSIECTPGLFTAHSIECTPGLFTLIL